MGIQGIKKPRHAARCSQSVKIKTLSPPKTKALIFPNLRISKENVDSISLYAQVAKVFFQPQRKHYRPPFQNRPGF